MSAMVVVVMEEEVEEEEEEEVEEEEEDCSTESPRCSCGCVTALECVRTHTPFIRHGDDARARSDCGGWWRLDADAVPVRRAR